ncbi:MAG TPA: alpha/beta fold hydrolase [Stellaceae bacterium]|nr:alpha/beta fold hydrolase [Stellaceae bacterium]
MAQAQKIEFPGASGALLAARLDFPAKPRAYALFAHCFTCGKDIVAAQRIAERLTRSGIAVLRFDFTGIGSSAGEFANTNFSSNIGDLVAAADYLRRQHAAPALLIGHSLGGAAVLAAAPKIPEATAIATIGAPASAARVAQNFAADLAEIAEKGKATVTLAGRAFTITRQFLDDIAGQDFLAGLMHLRKALLVCHAPGDEIVGIDNASAIFLAARHPKSFLSLGTADHLVRKRADAVYLADVIAAWAARYLPAAEEADAPALPPGVVEVSETLSGHLTQRVSAGRHVLLADEPAELGGDDAGPGPYDHLLAALGACTSMTMRLYAERKGIAAERFTLRLSHHRIHAEDCADCESKQGTIGEITRDITIDGAVSDDERARLLAIADRCPVHGTLTHEIKIRTRLVR